MSRPAAGARRVRRPGRRAVDTGAWRPMNYEKFFADRLHGLKAEGRYRIFADLARRAGHFPAADNYLDGHRREITVWCSSEST